MSTQNINLPAFPQTFPTQASLPAVGFDGQLAVVLLDHSLWVFDVGTLTWSMVTGGGGGGGTVLSVSVVSAHGLAGTVANPTTTPAISLSTTVTGILKGDGTSISAAIAGDFPTLNQNTTGTAANITDASNSTITTLTALSLPGSQVTGNISGNSANVTGIVAPANGGTGTNIAFTPGSIVFAGTSGVYTEDNADLFWNESGDKLQIGPRAANPQDAVLEAYSATSTNIIHAHNTGAQGSGGGALLNLSAVPTTAILNGSRLGGLQYAGSTDTTQAPSVGASINGVATQNWGATATGTKLIFNTVANNTTTRITALTLDQDQSATFANTVTATTFVGALTGNVTGNVSGTAANVTGTVAIANGGTGQTTKAPAFDALSPMTTGGDLIYGGASGTGTRLANGSAGNVLISAGGTSAPTWGVGGTAAATASTLMARDANANSKINNIAENLTTTATAAGTTTLTVSSSHTQQFTGTSTQTVVLPDATTLSVGHSFNITNRSTGIVTVNANGGGFIQTMVGGSQAVITAVTVGTSAGTWDSQYSVSGIVAAVQPTVQRFTSGSGTYTTPAGVQYIKVTMIGGGGGGAGAGSAAGGSGGAGGTTTFGSSLLTCTGGGGGTFQAAGGGGGAATVSAPAITITAAAGGVGGGAFFGVSQANQAFSGGMGAASPFSGNGSASQGATGTAAAANSGSGGGGGSQTFNTGSSVYSGSGGGSGGFVVAIITSPASTYAYAIGAAGTAGTAGTSGTGGNAGGSGYIQVEEFYTNFSVGSTTTVAANTFLAGPTGGANAAPTFRALTAPTIQKFTSGSGTYTTPTNPAPLYIEVEMCGGGGGGGGSGSAGAGNGVAGGNTTFGSSLLVANGGGGATGNGGGGGSASLGTGPIGIALSGGIGQGGQNNSAIAIFTTGGSGGNNAFGGAGGGTTGNATGSAGAANTGGGGGGAGTAAVALDAAGGGGGAGGYVKAIITSPASTYAYAVGAAGTGGGAGTNGAAGGAGGTGVIIVREYYQ